MAKSAPTIVLDGLLDVVATATRMIACAQCGMHLPEHEAVTGRRGLYCCHEHRRQCEEG